MRKIMLLAAILVVAGCAGSGSQEAVPRAYDLGFEAPATRLSSVRALSVRASQPFDTSDMLYRLAFRNPAELHIFSESRWASVPAILLQRRFSRASDDRQAKCAFEFEIAEFTQVFSSKESSEFVLEGRVSVVATGMARVAERQFLVREQGSGANAAGGVAGATRAVDRLIGEINAWVSAIETCRTG